MSHFDPEDLASYAQDDTKTQVEHKKSASNAQKISADTMITHNGVELGKFSSLEAKTKCDCPYGHLHSDGKGYSYAHTIKLPGGDIGISCSGNSCCGLYIPDTPRFKNKVEPQKNQRLVVEDSKEVLYGDNGIIPLSAKEKLKGKCMNTEDVERALHMFFFLKNLIPRGYHIIIYGAAGSGKTTIVLHLMKELVIEHKDVEVYYFYLDGQLGMAANYELHLQKEGLSDRYNIITNGTADELLTLAEELVIQRWQ